MIEVGQIWKEVDSRFNRYVTILEVLEDTIKIQGTRITYAKKSRFNGKTGGYALVGVNHE